MNIKKNKEDRIWMIRYWAQYVKSNADQDWSKQQAILINSIIQNLTKKEKREKKEYPH
jgi:hypothetical protein